MLHVSKPSVLAQILVSQSIVSSGGREMKIVYAMRDALPGVEFTSVPLNMFDVKRGSMELRRMCTPECLSVLDMHEEKYYCIAAAAAVVSFTAVNLSSVFANQSTKVEFHTFGKSIMIGESCFAGLFLSNCHDMKPRNHEFQTENLNFCFRMLLSMKFQGKLSDFCKVKH